MMLPENAITSKAATGTLTFPTDFVLVTAMNPCPCGSFGDPMKECICLPSMITRYGKRTSGLLPDRIGIRVELPRVE